MSRTVFTKNIFYIILCAILLSLCACKKNKDDTIILDNTHPLALAPDVDWAVVNDPYAAYRKDCNWDAAVLGHCRKGDILQVKGKANDEKMNIWYLFENGWLPENCLSVYNNRFKAQTSSDELIKSES